MENKNYNADFLNCSVTYSSDNTWNFGIDGSDNYLPDNSGNSYYGYDFLYDYYWGWYRPIYIGSPVIEKSKTEQSFKIVKVLIEKKLISGNLTVKKFIGLVEEISNVM
jgi:hypothetical protein